MAVAATPEGDAIVVGRYYVGDDTDLGPGYTAATTAGQAIMRLSGATGDIVWSHATTDPEWIFPSLVAVTADGSPIVDGRNASPDALLPGTTQSFLRLTPDGDRGAGSWVRTLPAGTLMSPWTLAPAPGAGAGALIIGARNMSGMLSLDMLDEATGAPAGTHIPLAHGPYGFDATAETIALLAGDTRDGIDRWTTGGDHVSEFDLPGLYPQSLAFDTTGTLYVTFQMALALGDQIALGPGPNAPIFVAPANDSYFTLLELAP